MDTDHTPNEPHQQHSAGINDPREVVAEQNIEAEKAKAANDAAANTEVERQTVTESADGTVTETVTETTR